MRTNFQGLKYRGRKNDENSGSDRLGTNELRTNSRRRVIIRNRRARVPSASSRNPLTHCQLNQVIYLVMSIVSHCSNGKKIHLSD